MLALLERNGVKIFVVIVVVVVACQNDRQNGNFLWTNVHLSRTLSVDLPLFRALRVGKIIVALCCCPYRHYIFEFATILERAPYNIAPGNKITDAYKVDTFL